MPGQGVTSKAAFKIETGAWGTSIATGAGNQIHFISESVSPAIEQAQAIHLDGQAGAKKLYPQLEKYAGDLLIEAHYSGLESLFACVLGMSHQNLSPVSTSTDASEHYFEPSDDLSTKAFNGYEMTTPSGNANRRGTLCFEKTTSVWEFTSTMFNSMTFDASPERITYTFNVASEDLAFDSATNPNSSSWTLPSNANQILWDDMTVYIKARDSFTVSSSCDNFLIDESGSDVTLDIADDTYTGYELAQAIANAANASGSLSGAYECRYDEENRRFELYTTNSQKFIVSGDEAGMDMSTLVGITISTTSDTFAQSNFDAQPDAYAAFAAGDKLGVSNITYSVENNLDVESQDSESDLKIIEPERNDFRRVSGQIEIPRYKNDTFIKAVNGFTTYEIWINFIGSAIDSETYEKNIYFPAIKFSNADAPIAGAELIKQTLAFEAQIPTYLDLVNFAFGAYTFKTTDTNNGNGTALSAFRDGYLWSADEAGIVEYWDGDSWTTSSDFGTDNNTSILQFINKLYVGDDAGVIWEYDGESGSAGWSSSTDVGSSTIEDMVVYADKLYAVELGTGKIFTTASPVSSTSWSLSCDTTATNMRRVRTYKGNLYAIGSDGSTFTRIYKYNGTAWSTDTDFATNVSLMSMTVHKDKLYATGSDFLWEYDNTTWTEEKSGIGFTPQDMISYKGNLLLLESGAGDVYYYDFSSKTAVNIYSSLNLSTAVKFYIYEGNLFIAHGTTTTRILKPIQEILITNQNQNSTNPL